MKNKALQFETVAEAKAIARQLVAHTETTIAIKGKGKRVAATITPNGDVDESDDMVYRLLDADAGERLRVSDVDDETIADSYADNERLEFTDLDEARTATEAILAVCDLTIHIVDGDDNLVETMTASDEDDSVDEDTDDDDAVADTKADFPIIEPIKSPDVTKRQRTSKTNKPALDDIPEADPQPTLL